jgi:SAM-dependent methyltransferase
MEYTIRPDLYDVVYSYKDYASESARVAEIARGVNPEATTLLDVACGTGRHLEHLRDYFEVTGLDADGAMLEIAKERLPGVTLVEGDMTSFDLGRTFDVVTCLFSSIGFAHTIETLASAMQSLARHVAGNGVLLVEPWITPDDWVPNRPHALASGGGQLAVTRMAYSGLRGRISTVEMQYLVGTPDGIEHLTEHTELGLFTRDEMRSSLEATGLSAAYDPEGLIGRGLWLATRTPE